MTSDFPQAHLALSAGTPREFPPSTGPEYCVLGRSNVGKSSFINHVFADRSLARVSSQPGKTTLANFYRLSTAEMWIDLPGYGYAHVSKSEKDRLAVLVRECCTSRAKLAGVLWLLDIRHPGLAADRDAWEFIVSLNLPVLRVLTKCDKVTRNQAAQLAAGHAASYDRPAAQVCFSAVVAESRQVFWTAYDRWKLSGK